MIIESGNDLTVLQNLLHCHMQYAGGCGPSRFVHYCYYQHLSVRALTTNLIAIMAPNSRVDNRDKMGEDKRDSGDSIKPILSAKMKKSES